MTNQTYQITPEQQTLLDDNPHLHPVSFLDDGELLIIEDAGPMYPEVPSGRRTIWAAWLLTRDGKVQAPTWHYEHHHDWLDERPGREAAQSIPAPLALVPRILTVQEASQVLLLKYRVDVSERTVRNWMRDGKLAGHVLGDHDRAPWYTTHDAIDQAAKRDWFPPPEPTPTEQRFSDELVARAARVAELMDAADVDDTDLDAEAEADDWAAHLFDDVDDDERRSDDGLAENQPSQPTEA